MEKGMERVRHRAHLRQIDNTLPAKYTRRLYGSLPRSQAYLLLTQLRTGQSVTNLEMSITISNLLEGPRDDGRGKIDSSSWSKTVEAVLDFAEALQGFQSRTL
ncbi:unnamed protein product [Penicillium camemberti]|uniref:Str. FM013 n=1 Tax=Penicillium camemberti (strain FM 013) TaxID=1429867 RepID=A0A0G4PXQ9_PENC3|nr:unnamed protein product [Penicillium camemberti]